MQFLNLAPGPLVGEVMEMLQERRIEQGPYSEEEAYEIVRSGGRPETSEAWARLETDHLQTSHVTRPTSHVRLVTCDVRRPGRDTG